MEYKHKIGKIQYRDMEPYIRENIRDNGLYSLENIFGDSDGHGWGFGGEDISFELKKIKAFVEFTDRGNTNSLIVLESDELRNQKGDWVDRVSVDIRPETMKFIRSKLCK